MQFRREFPAYAVPILGKKALARFIKTQTDYANALAEYKAELTRADQADVGTVEWALRIARKPWADVHRDKERLRQMDHNLARITAEAILVKYNLIDRDRVERGRLLLGRDKSANPPFTTEAAIAAWIEDEEIKPKPKAIQGKRDRMRELFEFLERPDDLTTITLPDLQRYKEHLIEQQKKTGDANLAHYRLTEIRKLVTVAHNNQKYGPGAENPATRLKVPPKRKGEKREAYSDDDARKIIEALPGAPPYVEWPIRLMAALGAIGSEVIDGTTSDLIREGDLVIFNISADNRTVQGQKVDSLKTANRPRKLPLPAYLAEPFWAYVEGIRREYGPGPLFPQVPVDRHGVRSDKAGAAIRAFTRDLGVGGSPYRWRHRVLSQLEDMTDLKPDRQRYIAGHAAVDIHADIYLSHPAQKTFPYIDRINPTGPVKPVQRPTFNLAAE